MDSTIFFALILSLIFGIASYRLMGHPALKQKFIDSGLHGKDLHRRGRPVLPEAMGVVVGLFFLIASFLFIPFSFIPWNSNKDDFTGFPYDKLAMYLSGMLSLTCMLFLGFADDVLELQWRFKLLLPTIASIPLLMVYYVTYGVTFVVVPQPFRFLLGNHVDLGIFYYIYMGMLAVFCTNAINILAGINGVETAQALVISICIAINDCLYLIPAFRFILDKASITSSSFEIHRFSLCIVIPFISVAFSLYLRNKYPAEVFIGDTFCYFSGMIFAVLGILGRYSKTLLLFFIPQIFNFLYSIPQLFRFVPCPRHRMPRFIDELDLIDASYVSIKKEENISNLRFSIGLWCLSLFNMFGLVDLRRKTGEKGFSKHSSLNKRFFLRPTEIEKNFTHVNNLTLLNLVLIKYGPMREGSLTNRIIIIQILFGCFLAFFIRYGLVTLAYP